LKRPDTIAEKIFTNHALHQKVLQWRITERKIVFTNGVFDLLHRGHIKSLTDAAVEGDFLVVAINSDSSVKKLKGAGRPFLPEDERALILASLLMVDAVTIFNEDTPLELITLLKPDVLVKGGDYKIEDIVGAKEVIANGGRVVINPLIEGYSTTGLSDKIRTGI
jgi:D-glycero-beta-D-manno-heptose 1-phosphate adenylyltransferase